AVSRPRAKAPAAAGIDLTVRAGQAVGIVGPNGAGKSTTALTLAGLLPEFAGQVTAEPALRGKTGQVRPFAWPSALLAPRIGMVFQEPAHQFLTAEVAAELRLGPHLAGWSRAEVDDRVGQLLDVLGLNDLAGAHPQSLSGGEKRRLSVAAMLAPRPQVLIVDEPTFGQDALTWAGLVELFLDALGRGSAVVAVSHERAFLDAIGARRVDLCAFSTPASAQVPAGGRGECAARAQALLRRSRRRGSRSAHSRGAHHGGGQVQSADEDRHGPHPHGRGAAEHRRRLRRCGAPVLPSRTACHRPRPHRSPQTTVVPAGRGP